ncbi:MAG: SDR family oxidoreductase [Acidimicrobiia bacterium]|jgi:NAD(P)-dependent dehydrogenase (short-subunit alcohol dehydrogenase family)
MGFLRRRPHQLAGIAGTLQGRHILVTGGAGVLGRGIVRVLAEAGAAVTVTDLDQDALDRLVADEAQAAGRVTGTVSDVRDPDAIAALLDGLDPPLDGLVNNVGIDPYPREPADLDPDTMRTVYETNVLGPLTLTRDALARFRERETPASIVFITSIHHEILRRQPGYSTTKAALTMAMRELALDAAPAGIRVNAVAPGHVALGRRGRPIYSRGAPLGEVSLHPVEVGKAVWFLLNDDLSAGITGTTLTIDRGMSLVIPGW